MISFGDPNIVSRVFFFLCHNQCCSFEDELKLALHLSSESTLMRGSRKGSRVFPNLWGR